MSIYGFRRLLLANYFRPVVRFTGMFVQAAGNRKPALFSLN